MRRLEASGYVRREPHPDDGRAVLARLTDTGREVMLAATQDLVSADFGLSALAEPQLAALTDLLRPVRHTAGDF